MIYKTKSVNTFLIFFSDLFYIYFYNMHLLNIKISTIKIFLIVIVVAFTFQDCKKEEKEILTKVNNEIDTTQTELTIVDESFIDNPFKFGKVTVNNLQNTFRNLKIQRQPIKNIHVKNQVDSILTIKISNSEFILYKLPKEQFLESAVIKDKNIVLNKDIHVGMTKQEFKKKFDALKERKYIPPKISIGRKETQEYLIFTFGGNLLKEIEYSGYVD
jgi:hypothetical protein